MSSKRQATTELNRDNWDNDDPSEHEDMGSFKAAPKDVLEKRVMRTAKRRFIMSSGDDNKKGVFSGFEGFKKSQPSSFDFLSNLTNGSKSTTNGSSLNTSGISEASPSPGLFNIKPPSSTPSSGLFFMPTNPVTSDVTSKASNIFGPASKSAVFQPPPNFSSPADSIFNTSKEDSNIGQSPFKPPSSSPKESSNLFTAVKANASTAASISNKQTIPTIFSIASTNANQSTSPTAIPKMFHSPNLSGASPSVKKIANVTNETEHNQLKDSVSNEKNLTIFYSKLTSLNKSVTDWIKKHVEDTPLCILTPIFKDYEKYLKELKVKYEVQEVGTEDNEELKSSHSVSDFKSSSAPNWSSKPTTSMMFSNSNKPLSNNTSFKEMNANADQTVSKEVIASPAAPNLVKNTSSTASTFSFGIKSSTTDATQTTPALSFGIKPSVPNATNSSPVSFDAKQSTTTTASTPPTFSFGIKNTTTTTANASSASSATFSFAPKTATAAPSSVPVSAPVTFSFGIPPSNTATASAAPTFPFASKLPTATTSSASLSFGFPTSSSTATAPTFSFNAKPGSMTSTPTTFSYGISSTAVTTSPTLLFNSKPITITTAASSPFAISATAPSSNANPSSTFSFAMKSPSPQDPSATTAPFSFKMSSPISTLPASKPFSFGTGKPFNFNSSVEKKPETDSQTGTEEEDGPPKVEFTPVVEENSVYDKRCKIFVKKDTNFVDNGVGTLYIKKVEESNKHQLIVRANTNLGNVLINLILSKGIPMQRMGKNNVMMVCIPTPDAKPPPMPFLIRVKTPEEADELLETLNKYT